MIKITEIAGGQEKITLFSGEVILIGDSQGGTATLPISGRGLKPEHVKITLVDGKIWVQNLANDPFVTLNGQPFFKKLASAGDFLKIKELQIKIELEAVEESSAKIVPQEVTPLAAATPVAPIQPLPAEPKKPYLENLISSQENDLHDVEEVIHAPPKPRKDRPRPSLKDFDLPNDKESEKENFETDKSKIWPSQLNVSPFRHIKLFSFFAMVFFLILSVVAVEVYLRAGETSDKDEMKAAESLSDIAMALTYAQFYHISPKKHNWSDPQFIQNNLLSTIPTGSRSEQILNSQGGFANCGYLLRTYTSNDLSRFIIVAHPTPSLLQWLIPKSALLVDSSSMELKRIRDLKSLNRLLASLNTLDGINVPQLTELLKQGETIPLAYLARASKKPEFQPPRTLAFLKPGAENLIYNAPRYHPFGDALLKKAFHFASVHTSSHELAMLQSELEVLKKMPNLVLYTTDSPDAAKTAIAALKVIRPDEKYILGTIKTDRHGKYSSSKIVIDMEKSDAFITETKPLKAHILPQLPQKTTLEVVQIPLSPDFSDSPEIDFGTPFTTSEDNNEEIAEEESPLAETHTLQERLVMIVKSREEAHSLLEDEIDEAARKYLLRPRKKVLLKTLDSIKEKYRAIDEKTREDLFDLAFDFDDMDEVQLKHQVTQAGLGQYWMEIFHDSTP